MYKNCININKSCCPFSKIPLFPLRLRQLFGATSCGPKSVDHGGQGQAQRHLTENVFGEVPMCPKDS
jgi:hypothetical protein